MAIPKRKREQEGGFYGHGRTWFRREMIRQESSGSVFLATLKRPGRTNLPTFMEVKSSRLSASDLLRGEKEILDDLQGCQFIRRCYGEEITTGEGGEKVYNLLLERCTCGTLADYIKESDGTGLSRVHDVREYTKDIVLAVDTIYEHGYSCDYIGVHAGDILLVPGASTSTAGYVAKVGDLGYVAKRATKDFDEDVAMAPAIALGPDVWWDVGCILIEMLTGKKYVEIEEIVERGGWQEIPGETLTKEAIDFLEDCLAWDATLTTRRILSHPFIAGVAEEPPGDGGGDGDDGEEVNSWNCIPVEDDKSGNKDGRREFAPASSLASCKDAREDEMIPSFSDDNFDTVEAVGTGEVDLQRLPFNYEADVKRIPSFSDDNFRAMGRVQGKKGFD
ncbi:hypothetical protein RJ639_022405 [Escallonia herrerae]|uniref:Protein kinase domain-containing protein n=1 Tax=Escallonia herrerae TaxID=1293975 RepID=A0AA88V2U9_9ASTE|nr:hypothetical protein RJ639_022405 [Escallonia herrerae]